MTLFRCHAEPSPLPSWPIWMLSRSPTRHSHANVSTWFLSKSFLLLSRRNGPKDPSEPCRVMLTLASVPAPLTSEVCTSMTCCLGLGPLYESVVNVRTICPSSSSVANHLPHWNVAAIFSSCGNRRGVVIFFGVSF